jgi:O-antigen/teichoic acid export membrane protein
MYIQVSGNLISALVKLLFIILKLQLKWFVWSLFFDALIIGAGYVLAYMSTENLTHWRFSSQEALYLINNSWPLIFSALLATVYMKIDQLMISMYLSPDQLGIYSTVVNLSECWYFIPVSIVSSVFPVVMHARLTDSVRYQRRLQNMYDLMVIISLSIAIVTTFTSKFIYHIAFRHHPEYWSGAPILSVHIWAGIFVFLGSASGQYLLIDGHNKLVMMRTGAGALVNVVLNICWIPTMGILGAAYATLVGYSVATFFILFFPKTRSQGVLMLKSLFLISFFKKLKIN